MSLDHFKYEYVNKLMLTFFCRSRELNKNFLNKHWNEVGIVRLLKQFELETKTLSDIVKMTLCGVSKGILIIDLTLKANKSYFSLKNFHGHTNNSIYLLQNIS